MGSQYIYALAIAGLLIIQTVIGYLIKGNFSSFTYPGLVLPYLVLWFAIKKRCSVKKPHAGWQRIWSGICIIILATPIFGYFIMIFHLVYKNQFDIGKSMLVAINAAAINVVVGTVWVLLISNIHYSFVNSKKVIKNEPIECARSENDNSGIVGNGNQ
jgi:hypothetical protein